MVVKSFKYLVAFPHSTNLVVSPVQQPRNRKTEGIKPIRNFSFVWQYNPIWPFSDLVHPVFYGFYCFFVGSRQLWCDTLWKYFLSVLDSGATSSTRNPGRSHFTHWSQQPRNPNISSEAWWNHLPTFRCVSFIYFLLMETGHSLELRRDGDCWEWVISLAVYHIWENGVLKFFQRCF